jgi:hypothetical protein
MLNRFVNVNCSQLPSSTHLPQMKELLTLIAYTLRFEATHIYIYLLAWFLHVKGLGNSIRTFGQFLQIFNLKNLILTYTKASLMKKMVNISQILLAGSRLQW